MISKNIMFNEKVMGEVALKENKLLGLDFLTTLIALEDVDDKPSTNEKFETKEVTPIVNTWKS